MRGDVKKVRYVVCVLLVLGYSAPTLTIVLSSARPLLLSSYLDKRFELRQPLTTQLTILFASISSSGLQPV